MQVLVPQVIGAVVAWLQPKVSSVFQEISRARVKLQRRYLSLVRLYGATTSVVGRSAVVSIYLSHKRLEFRLNFFSLP